ncbi:MAG: DUF721 domain-containing protein [candidate division KSB1 bacterium]|nr:DUF721 domain-containing protein [candidate division KSB1 bacterium]
MKKGPKHIGETLESMFKDMGMDSKIKQHRIIQDWPDIVGQSVSNVTQAERIDNSILYVRVKSTTWRTELLFQKHTILKRINEKYGNGIIKDIRFH